MKTLKMLHHHSCRHGRLATRPQDFTSQLVQWPGYGPRSLIQTSATWRSRSLPHCGAIAVRSRCCTIMPGWHTSVCRFSYLRETLANVIRESVVPLHKRMGLTCPSSAKLGGAYLSSHQVGTTHFSRIGFSLDKSCQVGTSLEKWVISLHTHPSFDK